MATLTKVDETTFECKLSAKPSPDSIVKIKRYLNSELPCWGVIKIGFYENTSTLADDIIAYRRVGLIPMGVYPDQDEASRVFMMDVINDGEKVYMSKIADFRDGRYVTYGDSVVEEVSVSDIGHAPITSLCLKQVKGSPLGHRLVNVLITYLKPHQRIKLDVVYEKGCGYHNYVHSPVVTTLFEKDTLKVEVPLGVDPRDVFVKLKEFVEAMV